MTDVGIKETTEVVVAVNELAISVIKHLKDGVSLADIPAVISENIASVKTALEGCSQVASEMRNLDAVEIGSLLSLELTYIPKIINVIKS